MPRRIRQLPRLFGLLLGQVGFAKLFGKLFQRAEVKLFPVVLALLASGSMARATFAVTLEWDPSANTNVIGYLLYHGAVGGTATHVIQTGNQTTATVTNLFGGTTNFFFVVTYDAQLVPSVPSEVVVTQFPGIYLRPTVSAIADQIIHLNTTTDPIAFTINDAQFPAGQIGRAHV